MTTSDIEQSGTVVRLFANGCAYFSPAVNSESKLYDEYKANRITVVIKEMEERMEVLEFLEKLGFPMDEAGTYYYKDLIVKIIELLEGNIATREQIEEALESEYSQLYFDVARNELDLGIKFFREFVYSAFEKIDIESADPDLLEIVVERMNSAISNNQLALIIAEEFRTLKEQNARVRSVPNES